MTRNDNSDSGISSSEHEARVIASGSRHMRTGTPHKGAGAAVVNSGAEGGNSMPIKNHHRVNDLALRRRPLRCNS
jgi:hypothetical protein